MKYKKVLIGIFIIIIIIFCGVFYYFYNSKPLTSSLIDLEFYTYKGEKYSLNDFKGKYVLLNLFSSYCNSCSVELNIFNKLNNICMKKDFEIVSLIIDKEGIPLLPQIVRSYNLSYTVGIAPSNIFKIFPDFSITPTTYIFNQKGHLVEKITGYENLDGWLKILKKYNMNCN